MNKLYAPQRKSFIPLPAVAAAGRGNLGGFKIKIQP